MAAAAAASLFGGAAAGAGQGLGPAALTFLDLCGNEAGAGGAAALAHGLIDVSYALPDLMLVWVFMFSLADPLDGQGVGS